MLCQPASWREHSRTASDVLSIHLSYVHTLQGSGVTSVRSRCYGSKARLGVAQNVAEPQILPVPTPWSPVIPARVSRNQLPIERSHARSIVSARWHQGPSHRAPRSEVRDSGKPNAQNYRGRIAQTTATLLGSGDGGLAKPCRVVMPSHS